MATTIRRSRRSARATAPVRLDAGATSPRREGWNSRLDELQAAILRAKLPFARATRTRAGARSRSATTPPSRACPCASSRRARARFPRGTSTPSASPRATPSAATSPRAASRRGIHYPVPAAPASGLRVPRLPARRLPRLGGSVRLRRLPADLPALSDAQVDTVDRGREVLLRGKGDDAGRASPSSSPSTSTPRACRGWRSGCGAIADSADFDVEVLFVDDGSGDASWDAILADLRATGPRRAGCA